MAQEKLSATKTAKTALALKTTWVISLCTGLTFVFSLIYAAVILRPDAGNFIVITTVSARTDKESTADTTDCQVSFQNIRIDINQSVKQEKISLYECQKLFFDNKLSIIQGLCDNASGLGNFFLTHGQKKQFNGELECPDTDDVVTITGTFSAEIAEDFEHDTYKKSYNLEEGKRGKKYRILLESEDGSPLTELNSGSTIKVRGNIAGSNLSLGGNGSSNVQVVNAEAGTLVSGDRSTLVILSNFTDKSLECAKDSVNTMMFADESSLSKSVNKLYKDTTYNTVSFSGTTVGPFTINYSSTGTCSFGSWASAALAAAQAAGISTSGYQHIVYVFPRDSSCTYAGLASVGGSLVYVLGYCNLPDVFAHELGHNLGMNHASTPTVEYGDTSDFMGYAGVGYRQVNGLRKKLTSWIPSGNVLQVTGSGDYTLSSTEILPATAPYPMLLKIYKADTKEHYFISYRQPLGYDATLKSSYVNRVNIHRGLGASVGEYTYYLSALSDAGVFTDTANGIAVTQIAHTADAATVRIVQPDQNACIPYTPGVSVSGGQGARPGETRTYTVTVANKDNTNCTPSAFTLTSSIPLGWTGSFSPTVLTISPGSSAVATFFVTSPATATEGKYNLNISVSDAAQSKHTASVVTYYTVDITPPTAPVLSGSIVKRKASLKWAASTDNFGVSAYAIYKSGIKIAQTSSLSYTDSLRGSASYYVVALDIAGNVSIQSNAVVLTIGK